MAGGRIRGGRTRSPSAALAERARSVARRVGARSPRLRRLVREIAYLLRRALGDAQLGDGVVGRLVFVGAHAVLAAAEALPARPRPEVGLSLRLAGRRRRVRVADRSELYALGDVFLRGEYDGVAARDPRVIVDLGANVGAATLYFDARFPRARIYAVEPDPATARRLRRNVGQLANVEVLECAVGGRTGAARFASSPHSSGSRLASPAEVRSAPEVSVYTLDDLLERCRLDHVDVLKLDIEGAEFAVLEQSSRLAVVDEVVGELHPDHPDRPADAQRWLERVAQRSGLTLAQLHDGVFALRRAAR